MSPFRLATTSFTCPGSIRRTSRSWTCSSWTSRTTPYMTTLRAATIRRALARLPSCTGDGARSPDTDMTRVAIIGGGIGGLTAANALSRAGIEVAVYEAAAELKEIGAGVALHPNAMKVLRAIGVEGSVRGVAGQAPWRVMRNWKTGRVAWPARHDRAVPAAGRGPDQR